MPLIFAAWRSVRPAHAAAFNCRPAVQGRYVLGVRVDAVLSELAAEYPDSHIVKLPELEPTEIVCELLSAAESRSSLEPSP